MFCLTVVVVAINAEAPGGGYSYNRPSSGGFSSGGFSSGSGGGYRAVASGYTTSEGQNIDQQLLEQIRQIVLREESKSSSLGGGFSSGGGLSSSYGVPQQSYGAPSYSGGQVSDVNFEGVRQALQVAQFEQSSGGYSGGAPSQSYGAPSQSYGAPSQSYAAPSQSYGAPSSSYGVPQ